MSAQESTDTVAFKLERLAELYRQCQASELMGRTLEKLFDFEAQQCLNQISDIEKDLEVFEKKYGRTSDTFFLSFKEGKAGDTMDLIEWASLIQMVERLKKRLALLTIDTGLPP